MIVTQHFPVGTDQVFVPNTFGGIGNFDFRR
jgi:hypothetical protein